MVINYVKGHSNDIIMILVLIHVIECKSGIDYFFLIWVYIIDRDR